MSEELVEEPFGSANKRAQEAYDRIAVDLKTKVQRSKADALKKISG